MIVTIALFSCALTLDASKNRATTVAASAEPQNGSSSGAMVDSATIPDAADVSTGITSGWPLRRARRAADRDREPTI